MRLVLKLAGAGSVDVVLIKSVRKAGSTFYSRTTNLVVINYFEDIPRKKDTITTPILDGVGATGALAVVNGSGSG